MQLTKRDKIADDLRQRIVSGEYQPDSRLPTEDDLRATYGVSRGTVQAAVDLLEYAGLVERRPGRTGGSFVRRRVVVDIYAWRDDQPMSSTSEADLYFRTVREQGYEPSQEYSTRIETMPAEYATLLRVEPGGAAVVRRCARFVDAVPHSIQDSWYPEWLCDRVPDLRSPENIPQGTTRLLADAGFRQVAAWGGTTADNPTPDEASMLRIASSRPVLRNVLTGYTVDGPLRISAATFAADRTRLVVAHGDVTVIDRFRA